MRTAEGGGHQRAEPRPQLPAQCPTGAPAIAASAAPIVTGSILGPLTCQAQTGSTAGLDTHLRVYRDSASAQSHRQLAQVDATSGQRTGPPPAVNIQTPWQGWVAPVPAG